MILNWGAAVPPWECCDTGDVGSLVKMSYVHSSCIRCMGQIHLSISVSKRSIGWAGLGRAPAFFRLSTALMQEESMHVV